MVDSSAEDRAVSRFEEIHGHRPTLLARAPGRVNLIGEHTDYNDGFVLPMALPFATVIAAEPTGGRTVTVDSEGFGSATFDLDTEAGPTAGWARYLHGMAAVLAGEGRPIGGWRGAIATDIPAGASLSSSAALEVGAGLVHTACGGGDVDPFTLARLGQRVENEIMGLPSGIMDQLASAASVAGAASLIDCRHLTVTPVPLPAGMTVVVMDTGTRRELVASRYADRQRTCARVAARLGVTALRDATLDQLDRLGPDDDEGRARARHVITENERTVAAARAMGEGDIEALGQLMDESHRSLRHDYEVSGPALDAMVELAQATPGCVGARMTGGGFAGGAVAAVRTGAVEDFCRRVSAAYIAPPSQPAVAEPRLYPVDAAPGASLTVV